MAEKDAISSAAYGHPLDTAGLLEQYLELAAHIRGLVADTAILLNNALDSGETVLFEGAQGTMLDIDHGTYPYVTSSNAISGGASTGLGVAPTRITGVVGVTKAYTTRVGSGPFPTEMPDLDATKCARAATSLARSPDVRAGAAGSIWLCCAMRKCSMGSTRSS